MATLGNGNTVYIDEATANGIGGSVSVGGTGGSLFTQTISQSEFNTLRLHGLLRFDDERNFYVNMRTGRPLHVVPDDIFAQRQRDLRQETIALKISATGSQSPEQRLEVAKATENTKENLLLLLEKP